MKKRILAFLGCLLLLVSIFPFSVFANEVTNEEPLEQKDLNNTSIEEDFNVTFNGLFKIEDYPVNKAKSSMEIIALTEQEKENGEIELFFYLYNPSADRIRYSNENKISISFNDGRYERYEIKQIGQAINATVDISSVTNGSLIKYKVLGTSFVNNNSEREYTIGELELRNNIGLKSHKMGSSYNITDRENGIKDIYVDKQKVVSIDEVGHTFYRVQGNTTEKHYDIRTVYFAVDSSLYLDKGMFNTVYVDWEEKELKPILLLDDHEIVKAFNDAAKANSYTNFKYSFGAGMRPGLFTGTALSIGHLGTEFKYVFNYSNLPGEFYDKTSRIMGNSILGGLHDFVWSEHYHKLNFGDFDGSVYDKELDKIYLSFYCEAEADAYVSGLKILHDADKYDGKLDDLYSNELFNSTESFKGEFKLGSMDSMNNYEINTNFLNYVFNGWKYTTKKIEDVEFSRFQEFNYSDINLTNEELSELYKININDIEQFKTFCQREVGKNIYILRYSVTETDTYVAQVFGDEHLSLGAEFLDNIIPQAECCVCNGILEETVMVNDFDIIELAYDDGNGTYISYPVHSTPTDSIPDLWQDTTIKKPKEVNNWWQDIIKIIKVILIVICTVIIVIFVSIVVSIIALIFNIKKRKVRKNEKKNN